MLPVALARSARTTGDRGADVAARATVQRIVVEREARASSVSLAGGPGVALAGPADTVPIGRASFSRSRRSSPRRFPGRRSPGRRHRRGSCSFRRGTGSRRRHIPRSSHRPDCNPGQQSFLRRSFLRGLFLPRWRRPRRCRWMCHGHRSLSHRWWLLNRTRLSSNSARCCTHPRRQPALRDRATSPATSRTPSMTNDDRDQIRHVTLIFGFCPRSLDRGLSHGEPRLKASKGSIGKTLEPENGLRDIRPGEPELRVHLFEWDTESA